MPRLNESAQIPDFSWKLSFLVGGFDTTEDFPAKLSRLESLVGFCVASADTELESEVNAPKRSDPSKLLSGTAANGSTMLILVTSVFGGALASGCTTGSVAAKRSTGAGTAGVTLGWEANRSTAVCINGHRRNQCRSKLTCGPHKEWSHEHSLSPTCS